MDSAFKFQTQNKKVGKRKMEITAPRKGLNHQITINQNLNKYAFLLTLVHEIAHLITYVNHGWNVKGHGPEWKNCFKKQITPFMRDEVFLLICNLQLNHI